MAQEMFSLTPVNLGQFLSLSIVALALYSFILNLAVGFDRRMLLRDGWIFACGLFSFIDYFILRMDLPPAALILINRAQLAIVPPILLLVTADIAAEVGFRPRAAGRVFRALTVVLSLSAFVGPLFRYRDGLADQTIWYFAYFAACVLMAIVPLALALMWFSGKLKGKAQALEMAVFLLGFAAVVAATALDGSPSGVRIGGQRIQIAVYAMSSLAAFGLVSNVLRYKRVNKEIIFLANYDELTGALKRKSGMEEIERRIKRHEEDGQPFSVILLDLNDFKKLNDLYGYNAGNLCLKEVAAELGKAIRPGDTLCRTEGDEFMIVADGAHRDWEESPVLGRVSGDLAAALRIGGRVIMTSYRIGVSVYPEHGRTVSELLRNADDSLGMAKGLRGRKLVVFDTQMAESRKEAYLVEERLKETLRGEAPDSEFFLHYQPKVDSRGSVLGVEGLLRWRYRGRLYYPDTFIHVAEKTGLIHEMGSLALRYGCRDLGRWLPEVAEGFSLSINLSPQQLNDADIADSVRRAIEDSGVPPQALELELTESVVMDFWNSQDALGFMQGMRDRGVKVSIDDFGTGQSSFARLLELPADILKIDRSFVERLPGHLKSRDVCLMIVKLAHDLGMRVVAEGVETREQADCLFSLGCDLLQGYYFYKPMPAAELFPLLPRVLRP